MILKQFVSLIMCVLLVQCIQPNKTISSELYSVQQHTQNILSFGPRSIIDPGHLKTQQYIQNTLRQYNGWTITLDRFNAVTPLGSKQFTNIIADFDTSPSNMHRIVFAAHYESKLFREFEFLGATDSALSCALLLELAKNVSQQQNWNGAKYNIQLIFFDGEEAIEFWSPSDSLYGSRHLALKWHLENNLSSIKLFVLLDLLGALNPDVYNFDTNHQDGYDRLLRVQMQEETLRRIYFKNITEYSYIEDDHTPFMEKGVPVIHVIPQPFPEVWHTKRDNYKALHWDSIGDLVKIFKRYLVDLVYNL